MKSRPEKNGEGTRIVNYLVKWTQGVGDGGIPSETCGKERGVIWEEGRDKKVQNPMTGGIED